MVCSPPPTFRGRWSWPRCRSSPVRPISYFRLWAFGSSCPLPMGLPPIFESSGLANSSTCSHPCSGFSVCLVASWIGKQKISYPLGLSCSNESVHGRFYTMTFGMTGRNFLPWMPAIIFAVRGTWGGGGVGGGTMAGILPGPGFPIVDEVLGNEPSLFRVSSFASNSLLSRCRVCSVISSLVLGFATHPVPLGLWTSFRVCGFACQHLLLRFGPSMF